jgi:hypothetical protein
MLLYTQHATGALVEDDVLKNTCPIAVLKESENPDLVCEFVDTCAIQGTRKGAPFACINPGLVFFAVFRHHLCSMFKASSRVSRERIHMHENARPGWRSRIPL